MPSESVEIREIVAALETIEAYTRSVKQLLKVLPQDTVIDVPVPLDPGTLPRYKGCGILWLGGSIEPLGPNG